MDRQEFIEQVRHTGFSRAFEEAAAEPSLYTPEEQETLARIERDLEEQLAKKPSRLAHSYCVGYTAGVLARLYAMSPALQYKARIAGDLHDWEKAHTLEELYKKAEGLQIENEPALSGVDLSSAKPLLHGFIAKRTLAEQYPFLDEETLQAVALHTLGGADLSDLEKIVYIADTIEPLRGPVPRLVSLRKLAGEISLAELYFMCYASNVAYVIQTRRYLLPRALEIYNALVLQQESLA